VLICTISTADDKWLNIHAARWLRKARESNPTARLGLILIGGELRHPVAERFDVVKHFAPEHANRPFFNEIRMDATNIFGVEDACYVDCDCDILEPLDEIKNVSDKEIIYCNAQTEAFAQQWANISEALGYGTPTVLANNGFLFMRRSFVEEYAAARKRIEETQKTSRIGGLLCFNLMLEMYPGIAAVAPYEYSVISDDIGPHDDPGGWLRKAKTIQYAADRNQSVLIDHEMQARRAGIV